MHMHLILGHLETQFVAGAISAGLRASAGHPLGVHVRVMISPEHLTLGRTPFTERRAAKFTAPHDERFVEEPAFF